MIWVTLAAETVSWSAWLWQHRQEFEPVLRKLGDAGNFAQAALANPDGALRRAGNTLLFGQPGGGEKLIVFVEQTAPRVEHIERAVGGLQTGQVALSASLASLQTLSMVTLGLTALTPVVLVAQFVALNRQLAVLQKQIAHLDKKVSAQIVGRLQAGLTFLRQGMEFLDGGDRVNAQHRLNQALPFCTESMKVFGELLGNELRERKVRRAEVRLLARHLSVAVAGAAGCQIGLEQDQNAFSRSGEELNLLKQAARWVFRDTVGGDPAAFLAPPMRDHGVTIDFLVNLFRQARDAGAVDACPASAAAWFEEYRPALFRVRQPLLGSERRYGDMKARLREAVSAIEETNRITGLARLVQETKGRTLEVREAIRKAVAEQGTAECPYLVWGLG